MLGIRLASGELREFQAQARKVTSPWIEIDEQMMGLHYNHSPFAFRHRLHEHPSFSFGAITTLCRRMPPELVPFRLGKVADDLDFDHSFDRRPAFVLDDALARMEELGAYVCVNNPERDPVYRPIVEELVGEIALRTEPIDSGMNWYSTYLFVSASESVTPYHMDREMNFLLQIRGDKQVQLWNPDDPEVMTPQEQDELLAQAGERRPPLREAIRHKAQIFPLAPGEGVHHPFIAPHLVKTGGKLSISLAITFRTRGSDERTAAHQMNHKLRSFGLNPRPVGRVPLVDRAKCAALLAIRRARSVVRPPGG